jgi:nucleotide-binding universal stress UspA family protein
MKRGPIVVGVDDSPAGRLALDWAIVRAQAAGEALKIVHAVVGSTAFDPYGVVVAPPEWNFEEGRRVLGDAVKHASASIPCVQVATRLCTGTLANALLDETWSAGLLVLGRTGGRPFGGRRWTLAERVARHAPGRVVVVEFDNEVLL